MPLACWRKLPNLAAVQCLHHADAGKHGWAAQLGLDQIIGG